MSPTAQKPKAKPVPYVYQEFPKRMYHPSGKFQDITTPEAEAALRLEGWDGHRFPEKPAAPPQNLDRPHCANCDGMKKEFDAAWKKATDAQTEFQIKQATTSAALEQEKAAHAATKATAQQAVDAAREMADRMVTLQGELAHVQNDHTTLDKAHAQLSYEHAELQAKAKVQLDTIADMADKAKDQSAAVADLQAKLEAATNAKPKK